MATVELSKIELCGIHERIMERSRTGVSSRGLAFRQAFANHLAAMKETWPKVHAAYTEWLKDNEPRAQNNVANELGYNDALKDERSDANPFTEGTQEHEDWNHGWWEAYNDHPDPEGIYSD